MAGKVVKPSRPAHHGHSHYGKSFGAAYKYVKKHPGKIYSTAGSGTLFKVTAQTTTRGKHRGKKVLIFRSEAGIERARAYQCCWKHRTNCNRQWIDCYAMQL